MVTNGSTRRRLSIFLSYGHDPGHDEYVRFALQLQQDLEARGHEVWIDQERLKTGESFAPGIVEGIDRVALAGPDGRLVYLMTPHSVRDGGYCLKEVKSAGDRGIKILPVMVATCKIPFDISLLHCHDMRGCVPVEACQVEYHRQLNRLLADLEAEGVSVSAREDLWRQRVGSDLRLQLDLQKRLRDLAGRAWVLQEVDRWLADPDAPRVFWLTAEPGAGKSSIAASLARHHPAVLAAYLFEHQSACDPAQCLRVLAYHIGQHLPGYWEQFDINDLRDLSKMNDLGFLFRELVSYPLTALGSQPGEEGPRVLLVDALDEAQAESRGHLARLIAGEFAGSPEWLRLLVTSRTGDNLLTPLSHSPCVREFSLGETDAANLADVRAFLREGLEAAVGVVGEKTLEAIVRKSEGNFLYATRVLDEIRRGTLDLQHVDQFPQGLVQYYLNWFTRAAPVHAPGQRERYREEIRPALAVIGAAFGDPGERGVDIRTLNGALGWEEDGYELPDFQRAMGALFPAGDGRIAPFHRSAMEWLTSRERAGDHYVSLAEGHRRLADWGWKQYARKDGVETMAPYAKRYLPLHMAAVSDWDKFEEILKDCDYVAAASETTYLWWYRFEKPEWHLAFGQWLQHLLATEAERGKLALVTMFFNAFWWWGDYVESDSFPYCRTILDTWSEQCQRKKATSEDKRLLKALEKFYQWYPRKSDHRSRAQEVERWERTREALLALQKGAGCDGSAAELAKDLGRLHLSALLDIYLGEAHQHCDLDAAVAFTDRAIEKLENEALRKEDRWMHSWFLWQRAEIQCRRGNRQEAWNACREALRKVVKPDHEVTSNLYRTMSDLLWAWGERTKAWICFRLALWHAYQFQAEPQNPDDYCIAFFKEMRERWLDRALAAAAQDPAGVADECRVLRELWLASPQNLRHPEERMESADLVRWLERQEVSALEEYALPYLPSPDDARYARGVLEAAVKNAPTLARWRRAVVRARQT